MTTSFQGGTRDLVLDGQTGILADPLSAEALCCDLAALGAAGRAHVGARFARDRILGEYADLFQDMLAARPKGRADAAPGPRPVGADLP